MATYNLEQQEQLDQFKHFWKTYGNLITWTLVLCVGAYAAWTGYLYWQNDRATKAAVLFEELDRAAIKGDVDKTTRVFSDLKDNYAGATFTEQGALLAAQVQLAKGKSDDARASLQWLADKGKNENLAAIARLRLAGVLMDLKKYDDALSWRAGAPQNARPWWAIVAATSCRPRARRTRPSRPTSRPTRTWTLQSNTAASSKAS
mgnify:CR=1 FL=1